MAHMLTIKDLETRPDGTYYTGPLEEAKAFIRDFIASTEARYSHNGEEKFTVMLSFSVGDNEIVTKDNCDGWGTGPTSEDAWRYALGGEFGPADDEFSAFPLTHVKDEAVRALVNHHFPLRSDVFYSEVTFNAVVLDDGMLWTVEADGDIQIYRK